MQPDRGRARPFCEREVKLAADVDLPTSVFWSSLAQIVSMSDDVIVCTARTPFGGALTAGRRKIATRGLWVNRRLPVDDRLWREADI